MYRIIDTHGTNQTAWTWAGAMEWLACASEDARIVRRFSGRLVAQRNQTRVY